MSNKHEQQRRNQQSHRPPLDLAQKYQACLAFKVQYPLTTNTSQIGLFITDGVRKHLGCRKHVGQVDRGIFDGINTKELRARDMLLQILLVRVTIRVWHVP